MTFQRAFKRSFDGLLKGVILFEKRARPGSGPFLIQLFFLQNHIFEIRKPTTLIRFPLRLFPNSRIRPNPYVSLSEVLPNVQPFLVHTLHFQSPA